MMTKKMESNSDSFSFNELSILLIFKLTGISVNVNFSFFIIKTSRYFPVSQGLQVVLSETS